MNILPPPTKYYLYIRKSTDEEDRQVLSLEAQLTELKEFAEKENVEIIETFIEKRTAKVLGREVFNSMLNKIESGLPHPIGILAWHPDRLSRNSIDGGKLIYLLDTGKLSGLKFPTFAFENNPSGKFFLAIGLSNAKYYVDNLSENVRRGNRAKLRRGEWPGQKPFGYIYDHRLRNIVPDHKKAKIVKTIYEEFATGKHTLKSISARLAALGGGKMKSNGAIEHFLTAKLYIGIMPWKGEVYEGKFQPLISKQLFSKVQEILKNRRKPRKSKKRHDFPFVGLFYCSCGSMITAQFAKGNGGIYRYYRCTRKQGACAEKYIQESELKKKIIEKMQTIALPSFWIEKMKKKLEYEEKQQSQSAGAFAEANKKKIVAIQEKLDKLLEGYLDNLIDEESYRRKKEELVQQKTALKNEQELLLRKQMSGWIEPMREFINDIKYAGKIVSEQSLGEIANFAQKIGTNRQLSQKSVHWNFALPFDFAAETLARRALTRGAHTATSSSQKSQSPEWCALRDSNPRPSGPKPDALIR